MRTDEKLALIVEELQKNCGDLHAAARVAGFSPMMVHAWMKDDKEAKETIEEAQRVGWGALESAAIQRAVKGVEKDVYYKGFVVGQQTEYSDGLLAKLLEARNPAFKKGEDAKAVFNGPTQINIMPRANTYEEWLGMKSATLGEPAQALPAPDQPIEAEYVEVPPTVAPEPVYEGSRPFALGPYVEYEVEKTFEQLMGLQ